jgi:hypothetical protein
MLLETQTATKSAKSFRYSMPSQAYILIRPYRSAHWILGWQATFICSKKMEPISALGIATWVIGLIPPCSSGFEMVTACFTASKDVREAMTLITVQKYLLIKWALLLRVQNLSDEAAVQVLEKRISNWPEIGPGVLDIPKQKLIRRREHMRFLHRVRFVLKDRQRFEVFS